MAGARDEDLVSHYVQQGWNEGRDPAAWFSVQDYLLFHGDVKAAGIDPFGHFLAHGRSEGRLAPPARGSDELAARFFADVYGRFVGDFPPGFDPQLYMLAVGLEGTSRWVALAHFIRHGAFEPRILAILRPAAELLGITGDCHTETDVRKALHCYALAELLAGDDPVLKWKLGDCHARLGQGASARSAYLQAIAAGGRSYSLYAQLGELSRDLGCYDDAMDNLRLASRLRGVDYPLLNLCRQVASERFQADTIRALALSAGGNDAAARQVVASAIEQARSLVGSARVTPLDQAGRPGRPKVALLGNDLLPQCKLYRITQKIDQLAAQDVPVEFYPQDRIDQLMTALIGHDCLIVYRVPVSPELIELVDQARKFGIPTFYDIDDLIFEDDGYPPPRAIMEDMLSPADYAGLVIGSVLYRKAMALCDYGIASTPELQEAVARIVRTQRCFLSRNALSPIHLAHIEQSKSSRAPRKGGKFVFFYGSGSSSHNRNFATLAEPLARIMRENPQTELRVAGALALGPEFTNLSQQITCLPFQSISEYWRELAAADVNLAPLEKSRFNDAKSEIKWMEAGMFGVPSVVSRSAVYEQVISDGQDGFLVDDDDQWESTLRKLVCDRSLGIQAGASARSRILRDYGLEKGGSDLLSVLENHRLAVQLPGEVDVGVSIPGNRPSILVVNIFYPPDDVGGATRVVEQTVTDVRALSQNSMSFEVLCGHEYDGRPGTLERYERNGIAVTSLSPFTDLDAVERSGDTDAFFAQFLDRFDPDLIHFHCIQRLGVSLLEVANRKNIPYVVTVHDGWWVSDQQFLVDGNGVPVSETGDWGDAGRLDTLRNALNRGAATIAVSNAQARLYEGRGVQNVVTVPNGSVALEEVNSPPDQGPVWLGLLGGLGMAKGGDLLREILRRRHYPNLRFLVVDHVLAEDALRHELWGENKIEVRGKTSFENAGTLYSRLHVVLAVSVCIESFGLVAREARRLGRWVIASSRGGMGEDVTDGVDGFIVDPARPEDYTKVLDLIDANPDRFRAAPPMCGELRSLDDVAADYLTIYRSLLAGERVRSPALPLR